MVTEFSTRRSGSSTRPTPRLPLTSAVRVARKGREPGIRALPRPLEVKNRLSVIRSLIRTVEKTSIMLDNICLFPPQRRAISTPD